MTERSQSDTELALVARAANKQRASSRSLRRKTARLWHVWCRYRKSQLLRRGVQTASRKLGFAARAKRRWIADYRSSAAARIEPALNDLQSLTRPASFETLRLVRSDNASAAAAVRQQLNDGQVCLLNVARPLNWKWDHQLPLLWQFQLHYHEFLLPLSQAPDQGDLNLISQTIESWLDECSIEDPRHNLDAWHPYCISRRLPVWFCLLTLDQLDENLRRRMVESAHLQAHFLNSHLEWDLQGNHLLENLRALTLASQFFLTEQSKQWRATVEAFLPQQIKTQILPHGEHFERCPMYHCQVLGNFLDVLVVAGGKDAWLAETLRPVCARMISFLAEIVHPDGEIPLLGDSCFGEAPSVDCLEQLANETQVEVTLSLDEGGTTVGDYWIYRDQNDFLIFDRGEVGARSLPAHAHCDLLTIESSLHGVRWIVDSGLFNYEDDPMRWYCRSSLSHNVVTIDDQNQCDIWSKFRMGSGVHAGRPNHGSISSFAWSSGSHDGYRHLGCARVDRLIGVERNQFWYCLDRLSLSNMAGQEKARAEQAETPQRPAASGWLHLGPEVAAEQLDDSLFELAINEHIYHLLWVGCVKVTMQAGWYCPEFGRRIENQVVEYSFEGAVNRECALGGWFLLPQASDYFGRTIHFGSQRMSLQNGSADRIVFSTADNDSMNNFHTFDWNLN